MSATKTSISWTDKCWNPTRGCSLVSAGCTHCYAMRQAGRFSAPGGPYEGLVRKTTQGFKWTGEVRLIEKDLEAPLRWKKPWKIFVNSMSDLFHESVPDTWIDRIFAVMALASHHTFQILTKRPGHMHAYFQSQWLQERVAVFAEEIISRRVDPHARRSTDLRATYDNEVWPLPNVWLGTSVENQATADERIPWLLKTPAAVRFISAEPLLEAIDLTWLGHDGVGALNALTGECWIEQWWDTEGTKRTRHVEGHTGKLNWCIIGGESGPKARPFNLRWGQHMIEQCQAAGVAVWMKQVGARPYIDLIAGSRYDDHTFYAVRDSHGADPAEWPNHLNVQEFPV